MPYGTVEIGGTKTDVAVGTSPDDMTDPIRVDTGPPEETLAAIADFFTDKDVSAIGIATFGPIDLDPESKTYGTIRSTPKPGWEGTPVFASIGASTGLPVFVETDVNGAALGEGRWGAAQGMSDFVYVTVGTGVGAGVVVAGEPISGARHPEAGHVLVRRMPRDDYPGTCPYHADCLEGMASGPSLEARFGPPSNWAGNESVLALAAHYIAQGLRDLVYSVAPERIIVGGGVSKLPGFHARLRFELDQLLNSYPRAMDLDLLVARPGLGDRSGLAGGLAMVERGLAG